MIDPSDALFTSALLQLDFEHTAQTWQTVISLCKDSLYSCEPFHNKDIRSLPQMLSESLKLAGRSASKRIQTYCTARA